MKKLIEIAITIGLLLFKMVLYGQNEHFSIQKLNVNEQLTDIEIDSTYYTSTIIDSILDSSISGLSVTSDVKLFGFDAYVRILLQDIDNGFEYLIYDSYYPMNKLDTLYHIEEYTYETSMLYNVSNVILKVEVHNAVCQIYSISYSTTPYNLGRLQFDEEKDNLKSIQDSLIILSLNQRLKSEDLIWAAGSTSITRMYYDQRKDLLPKNQNNEIPNLQGFDYYLGGIFEFFTDPIRSTINNESDYLDEFDWRNRHGANWITPVKTQECNHCWVFCPTSVAESTINLYFNQHLNYDLSEQHLASCSGGNSGDCEGGNIGSSVSYIVNQGIVTEDCFPYLGGDVGSVPCSNICDNPIERVSFYSYSGINKVVDNIKRAVILNGPICGGVSNLWHFMSIIGFKTLREGDIVYNGTGSNLYQITIQHNSPYIGRTCWLFKNSWGPNWGEGGAAYVVTNLSNLYGLYSLSTPESEIYDANDILCVDNDGDGYYSWGIGPKPNSCPNCPDEPDCDDSDPTLGPYDAQYGCTLFCESGFVNTPLYINGSTTWNTPKQINRDIEILSGATLNICNTTIWELSSECSIIIHPGGRLVLDGATITNPCGILWKGIEVWGNSATHQYEINGSYCQGYLELKNGATIENAICAVALWRSNYLSTTGGIIHASDAVFRNNMVAVQAMHYKNYSPINGKETDYNARFMRCQFIVDGDYFGDEDHVFYNHVNLDHVRGCKFQACDFSVAGSSESISYLTSAISGCEAGFSVSGPCENNNIYPCPSYDNSTFSGFFSAISAVNDGTRTPPTISVTHSSFNNNDFGIYVSNLSNVSVRFCDFDVNRQDNWPCGAGIFLENVLNYSIEENALTKTNTFNGEGYGVVIKNCAVQSKVYRNQFENLYCGNLAWGRNILMKSSNNYIGLEYGCNTNTGNTFDFYVLDDEGVFSGLQSTQGSSLAAARNTFSDNGYHIYNGGDHRITYYYYNVAGFENEKPLIYNEDKVQIDSTNLTDNCPSNFGNGVDPVSLVLTPAEKYQREQDYYEAYTAYNGLKAVYDSRIDGGNTNNMLYDIASATPSDMWALRTQLLGASPYLSREVLTDASDRDDVFTESVLFEILLSNPDELKKDSLMYHLRNKTNPLPQYMMNILDQVANGTTARTVMQNRMAAYRGEYTRAAGDIIRSLVNDTVLDITELRGWLANMKDFYADRDIIATYVDEGDFTNALTLANMLPSLYGLTGNDLVEHNDYVELLELYRDLYNDDRNIMQLDSAERVQVERIAFQGSGYPQAMAQAVLYGTNWESYAENPFDCPTLTLPQGGQRGGHTFTQEDLGRALGLNVSVKPNPATTWTAVDYTLPAKLSKATMTVSNALGVTVMSTELNGNQGQKVLDLRGLADGVYLYTIRCGEYVQSGKLVIAK